LHLPGRITGEKISQPLLQKDSGRSGATWLLKSQQAAITTVVALGPFNFWSRTCGLFSLFYEFILVDKAKRKVYILPRHKEKGR